jgi:hypothetical protein
MLKLSAFFGTLFQNMIFLFVCFDGVRCIFHTLAKKNFTKVCQHIINAQSDSPMLGVQNIDFFLLRHQSTLLDGQHLVFQIVKTTIKIIVGDPDPYL